MANALWFTKVPIAHLTEEGEGLPLGKLLTNKLFWIFAALMFAAGACELSMSQWASAFAESGLGVSKTVGDLAGPCLFAVLMGCARVIYAKFGDRLNLLNTQMLSAGLCVVAYLLAALSPNPLLALLGCGLCGLSVGILWPGTISVASRSLPKGGTAMFALLAGGTWQIFTRWILRNPSTVTDEFLRYVLIWASMIGSAYCFYKDKHLALDLVKGRAKGAFNVFLSVFIEAAIVFFVGYVFVYGGWKLTANATNVSSVMRIPFKLLYSILPISGIFIILARVLKYVQLFLDSKEKKGENA